MAQLIYDGRLHKIFLIGRDGQSLGDFPAYNNVTSGVVQTFQLDGLPNGDYLVQDQRGPSRDGDRSHYTSDASVGPAGIVKLRPFRVPGHGDHEDVGLHAGRKHVHDGHGALGPKHVTHLCVRTDDVAMSMVKLTAMHDPITVFTVRGNDHVPGHPVPIARAKR